jgi:S-adenosylmethionine synthetase
MSLSINNFITDDEQIDDMMYEAEMEETMTNRVTNRINLSDMRVGDRGYIATEGCIAELRDNGKSGGCEHDLWLALVDWEDDVDYPTIIVDTDDVSV